MASGSKLKSQREKKKKAIHADVAIVGAGLAGLLTAYRIAKLRPNAKVVVLEKEQEIGGRLRRTSEHSWGAGLSDVSPSIIEFLIASEPELQDYFEEWPLSRYGWLSGGKVSYFEPPQLFSDSMWTKVASSATGKEWKSKIADKLFIKEDAEQNKAELAQKFKKISGLAKKSASISVLQKWLKVKGIVDILDTSGTQAKLAIEELFEGFKIPDWEAVFKFLTTSKTWVESVDLKLNAQVFDINKENDFWQIETTDDWIETSSLVITPSPWQSLSILPKEYWPTKLLNYALKSKPVSLATLTFKHDLPARLIGEILTVWVSAEDVVVRLLPPSEVCLQVAIDYELSLDAPSVVKAMKSMRRAIKKVAKIYELESLDLDSGHLSLLPVAWSIPCQVSDQKLLKHLTPENLKSNNLTFCGDGYGTDIDHGQNLRKSVISAAAEAVQNIPEGAEEDGEDRRQGACVSDQGQYQEPSERTDIGRQESSIP